MIYLLTVVIVHAYVKLPEGNELYVVNIPQWLIYRCNVQERGMWKSSHWDD